MKLHLLGHLRSAVQQTACKQEWHKNTFYSVGVDKKLATHATAYIKWDPN